MDKNYRPLPASSVRIFSANTLADVPWPRDGYAQRYLTPFMRQGTKLFMDNVHTTMHALQVGSHVFPMTVNGVVYGQSYVCSIHTAFILYARQEIQRWQDKSPKNKRISLTALFLKSIVRGMEWVMNAAHVDQIVSVNNWLLSTNLYPEWSGEHLEEVTETLTQQYPHYMIVFRSLNKVTAENLIAAFKKTGYLLVPARQIYLLHQRLQDYMKKRDTQADLKFLAQTPYRVVHHDDITPADYPRIAHLYQLLYIEKYSAYNPQFTITYIQLCHEQRLLTMIGLRNDQGILDGVVGFFERSGVFTTPLLGYDTALPASVGLYRLLSTLLLRHAHHSGLIFNRSSGAAHFKRLRGAIPAIEYSAIYIQHLPWGRRAFLKTLAFFLTHVGLPVMEKYKL